MRILLISPGSLDVPGGNTSSILRLRDGLKGLGHCVELCSADRLAHGGFCEGPFDVVHAFHLRKGGLGALEAARRVGARLVVTLTGTETSLDWQDDSRRADVLRVLESGARVVALRASHLEELRKLSGHALVDAVVIPQTVRVGNQPHDLRGALGVDADEKLVLLPGGLRPVKGQDWALDALEGTVGRGVPWHLVLVGPVLDVVFAEELLERVAGNERAHYAGSLPQESMGSCYRTSDLVLNTSETEGESNAILEAMHVGPVVLARSNPGNRALIRHASNGMLFSRLSELEQGILELLGDGGLREKLAAQARLDVEPRTELEREIRAYLGAYGG